MKNGTQSSKLTLIDGMGQEISESAATSDPTSPHDVDIGQERLPHSLSPVFLLFTVSLACTVAAIVAGSYGVWLARQKAARRTLTDVQEILRLCQERMQKMDAELSHLPGSLPSVETAR